MTLSPPVAFHIASGSICASLILLRSLYRVLFRCRVHHQSCYRRWRLDDTYMALALLPLAGRTACISLSFMLNPSETTAPATAAEAAAQNMLVAQLDVNRIVSLKLHLPGRIFYALFLWTLKLCLLTFYSRFVSILPRGKIAIKILRWFIILSFCAVVVTTLVECHPLELVWELQTDPSYPACRRALANLLTMAICNACTNVALVVLPFPILRNTRLSRKAQIQLGFLFGIGAIVVMITILRLPFILRQPVSQQARSMWASIEVLCSCVVANTAFFYSVVKDSQHQHDDRAHHTSTVQEVNFYLQSLPSSPGDGRTQLAKQQATVSTA
ncbi:hypothetical protein TOPH_04081 [Tolypocladium ophioglossoides CBS 100239]|uniref:Rhodopsin domain-containing protein n=1 Tax=Tolypocladium ophioglossoides (strain CBS 100239) TaxID=1163406 RepID=A0A0L0NAL1_TOLOC|nr:hypothetical protein TOPH_04081 [Tolypocladium ophioglossoides CBS 100239]